MPDEFLGTRSPHSQLWSYDTEMAMPLPPSGLLLKPGRQI